MGGYRVIEPTVAELERWKRQAKAKESTIYTGLAKKPSLRLVPLGNPIPYEIDTLGARKALELAVSCRYSAAKTFDFYNTYGPLYAVDKTHQKDRSINRSRQIWEEGESFSEWSGTVARLCVLFELAQTHGKSSLISTFDKSNFGTCRVRLYQPRGRTVPLLRMEPQDLRAMLWLAAANTIAGGGSMKSCVVCGQLMIVGGGTGSYSSKQTCSSKCRMARSRDEKKRKP